MYQLFPKLCQILFVLMLSSLLAVSNMVSAAVFDAGSFTCGIQADNTLVCWGGKNTPTPPGGTFSQVSVGNEYACGIRTDHTVTCWGGRNKYGEITPPSGRFSQLSAGMQHTCGIKSDNTIACWGIDNYGQATPPIGTFSQLSAGAGFTCGIKTDNFLDCWGEYAEAGHDYPWIIPNGRFFQIDAAYNHICGIRTNNSLVCWGVGRIRERGDPLPTNGDGRTLPPNSGTFYQVAGGARWFTCWLRTDNAVVCSGAYDMPGVEAVRPPGSTSCTCGRDQGRVGCICESPSGLFYQITAGIHQACGIRPDNTVVCWGAESSGPIGPPRGFIVKSSDPKACLLYGVHDDGNDTQFFIINSETSEVQARGKNENYKDESYQIDALDIHPSTNQLYAASSDNTSKKGHLYQVRNGAQILTDFGETNFKEINGIAFHPDGMLWGWAQDAGLFQIGNGEDNEPDLNAVEVILPYNREDGVVGVEVNDLTWNTAGTILYGIGRILHQYLEGSDTLNPEQKLWVYDATEGTVSTACDNLMDPLDKVEALETLPDDTLLLGLTQNEQLIFLEIDVQTCEVMIQKEISTPYHNVKGLAQPDCSHPYVDTDPSTK